MVALRSSTFALAMACASIVAAAACTDLSGLSTAQGGAGAPADDASTSSDARCRAGQKDCAGSCVDVDDPAFGCGEATCERCSVPFADVLRCQAGKCAAGTCQAGRADCDGRGDNGCEADLARPATCGSCTTACGGAASLCGPSGCVASCPAEAPAACDGSCVDTNTSAAHCGACGNACAAPANGVGSCAAGQCSSACNQGFGKCSSASDACTPLTVYYEDRDGDTYGRAQAAGQACAVPPGFVAKNGDCNDQIADVRPGQTAYFAEPYQGASGAPSFDYDCSGREDADPQRKLGGSCNQQACVVGYLPTATSRQGAGVNAHCGSDQAVAGCGPCQLAVEVPTVACR